MHFPRLTFSSSLVELAPKLSVLPAPLFHRAGHFRCIKVTYQVIVELENLHVRGHVYSLIDRVNITTRISTDWSPTVYMSG